MNKARDEEADIEASKAPLIAQPAASFARSQTSSRAFKPNQRKMSSKTASQAAPRAR